MLLDVLNQSASLFPDKTAIAYDKERISYQQLQEQVFNLSKGLNSIGISEGDCVAIILPNCAEFVISFFALAHLNSIVLPLNPLFKPEEINYYLGDSKVKAIITDAKRAKVCQKIISQLDTKIELIVVNGSGENEHNFSDLLNNPKERKLLEKSSFAGDVIYQYSSGSTGKPKRVTRTQYNLCHEVFNFTETTKISSEDNILCIVPFYHAHGLGNCLLAAISTGATLVILESVLQKGEVVEIPFVFRRTRVLKLITTEKITILPAVPYLFKALAETPESLKVDISSLRLCFSAGNFLSQEIFQQFYQRFGIFIRQLYGCTEAGSIAINLDREIEKSYQSVGKPLNNVQLQIINEDGREVAVEEVGEIVIKSKSLTTGYYNMPDLNQQAFQNGQYFTGDLGKKDEDGFVYITGRKKLLIDTGGYKVDPIEVEDILIGHPLIKEAVVVGVKNAYSGETVKAVIVTKNAESCNKDYILSFCKERLAEFKVPKLIEFRDEIPKSALGKVLRKELVA